MIRFREIKKTSSLDKRDEVVILLRGTTLIRIITYAHSNSITGIPVPSYYYFSGQLQGEFKGSAYCLTPPDSSL